MSDKARTGRPLKEHAAGTLVTITLQVPAELKTRLQTKALSSNRTLSQEAQRRLERSFSIVSLQEDAVALAVAEAYTQFSERLVKEVEAHRRQAGEQLAELERRLAEDDKQRLADVQRLIKEARQEKGRRP